MLKYSALKAQYGEYDNFVRMTIFEVLKINVVVMGYSGKGALGFIHFDRDVLRIEKGVASDQF